MSSLLLWYRTLGAVVGDFLDKPLAAGGLALSSYSAFMVLMGLIIGCIMIFKQSAAKHSH